MKFLTQPQALRVHSLAVHYNAGKKYVLQGAGYCGSLQKRQYTQLSSRSAKFSTQQGSVLKF
jgi:hypothetical protein